MVDTGKAISMGVIRATLGAIPFAGSALNEVIFDVRNRIKQERLNKFVELLSEYFERNPPNEHEIENMGSEEFSDLLESVLLRVLRGKANENLKLFRNVLLHGLGEPIDHSRAETYLDILERLDPIHIHTLSFFTTQERDCTDLEWHVKKCMRCNLLGTKPDERHSKVLLKYESELHEFCKKTYPDDQFVQSVCEELTAHGLLRDVGSYEANVGRFCEATSLAFWLLKFVKAPQ